MHEDDGYFDEQVAARYDESAEEMFEPAVIDPIVDVLVGLAGRGRALELGIGTGRIALPLAQRGVPVHGIELSKAMVARLRTKPGGAAIGVTIGDFATTTVEGTFSVAYLVFNTIMNLTTQAAQVDCFRNVAAHLEPGGCFVVEVGIPDLQRLPHGDTFRAFRVTENRWGFDEYDVATQGLTSHHFEIVDGKVERVSMPFRYVWPSELDLMALLAGLSLRERWSGWKREPFTSISDKHISIWEKPAAQVVTAEDSSRGRAMATGIVSSCRPSRRRASLIVGTKTDCDLARDGGRDRASSARDLRASPSETTHQRELLGDFPATMMG